MKMRPPQQLAPLHAQATPQPQRPPAKIEERFSTDLVRFSQASSNHQQQPYLQTHDYRSAEREPKPLYDGRVVRELADGKPYYEVPAYPDQAAQEQ